MPVDVESKQYIYVRVLIEGGSATTATYVASLREDV